MVEAEGRGGKGGESMGAGVGSLITIIIIIVLCPNHHCLPSQLWPLLPSPCHCYHPMPPPPSPHIIVRCPYLVVHCHLHLHCCASLLGEPASFCCYCCWHSLCAMLLLLCVALALIGDHWGSCNVAVMLCVVVVVIGP